jgi:hypothetical protein
MTEVFTLKINGGYYVEHSKNYFKSAASKNDAKKINGKGALLSLLHTLYHCDTDFDEILINREATDANN